jgi:hypothetical protein
MRMRNLLAAAGLLVGGLAWLATPGPTRAADHADAPNVDNDSGADIADVFLFLDPADNTKVCILGTVHGFIVPGEAVNTAAFDPDVLYRFAIENTGDAKPDAFIDITFSDRANTTDPQTASIRLPGVKGKGASFTAPTTVPNLSPAAATQTVTTDPASGVAFFAGEVDDPFFFDIPAFSRFVASVKAGAPDTSVFSRGRDTFAGYNVLGIALSLPRDLIRGAASNNKVGVEFQTYRRTQTPGPDGVIRSKGKFKQVDRMGNPAVNVALIPFAKKSAYNTSSPIDDSKGKFASDIVATLNGLGTDQAHQQTLAGIAITNGDYIRVDLTIPNSGAGGGDNPEAAYPNGRRLKDDTIDIILTVINNGNTLGDNVNASDVSPQDTFPFFGPAQQPRDNGVIDDNTRN